MESGVEENVLEYVQMVSSPSVRRVKTITWEEVLDMSVEELRKNLDDRGQDTKRLGKPQLQRKLMGEILEKQKSPGSSPKKEWLMRSRALELKMSREEEKRN